MASLTNKFLFPAPNPPHYDLKTFPDHLIWIPATPTTVPIPCLWLQNSPLVRTELLVIWSHGNGCDIGSMFGTLKHYHHFWRAHILAYEYPGYGECSGTPSEQAINNHII